MSDKITFTGVVLRSFTRNPKGGTAKFSANFTQSLCETMGWGGITNGQTSADLDGSLAATVAQLQPKDGALARWMIEFQASTVKSFQAIRYELEGKKKKGFRYEVHFDVGFQDMTACKLLEEFMTHAGDTKSVLTVSYTKAAEQTNLVDENTPTLDEMRRQATIADAD